MPKSSSVTKISKDHTNRGPHNWLAYEAHDRLLLKYADIYKGSLYDLGCGEAPYKDFLLQYAKQYIGVDWAGSIHRVRWK